MAMKSLSLLVSVVVLVGCATTESSKVKGIPAQLSTDQQKSSYALGAMHIKILREGQYPIDQKSYEQGLRDALDRRSVNSFPAEANVQSEWQALVDLNYAEVKAANLAAGKAFLEHNKSLKEVMALDSGLQYKVLKKGKSTQKPTLRDKVGVIYKISGIDGKVKLDNTKGDVQKLYEFPVQKMVSKGWQEALLLMPKGSKWRLFIPGELAFGEKGLSEKGILPNETLVIEIYLDSIDSPPS